MHDHDHSTHNIRLVFFLNLGFTVLEAVGGLYVNSVSILSDALHDLGDSISLGLSWYLDKKSKRSADKHFTFGYQRFSLLSALINSMVLIIGSVFVLQETIGRLIHPESSNGEGMLYIAIGGVVINSYAAWKLSHGKSMNERVLSWHLIEDVLGWVAVLIVSIVLLFKDIQWLDPLLSLAITLFILWNVFRRLRETLVLFLQGTPGEFDLEELIKDIENFEEVRSVHSTHLWSLDGATHVFSTHLVVNETLDKPEEIDQLKERIRDQLKTRGLTHITIEIEFGKPGHSHAHP
jgi:cobalt-zinc-cadmium efflux system protein